MRAEALIALVLSAAAQFVPSACVPLHAQIQDCSTISEGAPNRTLLVNACEFATNFRRQLPDFVCEQTTTSTGLHWSQVTKAQVTFENGREHYSNVRTDEKIAEEPSPSAGAAMKFSSEGELGSALLNLFTSSSLTEFKYRKQESFKGTPAQAFSFHVPEEKNSFWELADTKGNTFHPEISGDIWLDRSNGRPLRLQLKTERLPHDFQIAGATVTIDYSNVTIPEAGTFWLPSRSETQTCLHSGSDSSSCRTNLLVFHDCRKFGSSTRIVVDEPTH